MSAHGVPVRIEVSGGEQFERWLRDIALSRPAVLEVGFFEDAWYPDGTPVAQVAAWQEYGTDVAPARPFMRPTFDEKGGDWLATFIAQIASGASMAGAFRAMGNQARGDIADDIANGDHLELSPVTLMVRKMQDETPGLVVTGSTVAEARLRVLSGEQGATGSRARPLMDTTLMFRSVAFEVTE